MLLLILSVLSANSATSFAQNYHWIRTFNYLTPCVAFNPLSKGKVVFTATPDTIGVFRSDDGAMTWQWYGVGLNPFASADINQIFCLPSDTNVVIGVGKSQVFRSTDGGHSWAVVLDPGGIEGEDVAYYAPTNAIYYGENFKGPTWRSLDSGKSWQVTGQIDTNVGLCTLAISQDNEHVLLAGSADGVIAKSTNEGGHWDIVYPAERDTNTVHQPEIPKIIYSDWANGVAVATRWHSVKHSMVETTNHGTSWQFLSSPEYHVWSLEIDQKAALVVAGRPTHLWTGLFLQMLPDTTAGGMIEESTDGGVSWHATEFPKSAGVHDVYMLKADTSSDALVAATDHGIFVGRMPSEVRRNREPVRDAIQISQNPATSVTHLSWPGLGESVVCVNDEVGRVIFQSTVSANSLDLHLASFPVGPYFIYIKNNRSNVLLPGRLYKAAE